MFGGIGLLRLFFGENDQPVSSIAKHIAIGAGGLGFDSRAGQIRHNVANCLSLLQRFVGAVLPRRYAAEKDPATRYTPQRNTVSIMRICLAPSFVYFFGECCNFKTLLVAHCTQNSILQCTCNFIA